MAKEGSGELAGRRHVEGEKAERIQRGLNYTEGVTSTEIITRLVTASSSSWYRAKGLDASWKSLTNRPDRTESGIDRLCKRRVFEMDSFALSLSLSFSPLFLATVQGSLPTQLKPGKRN